jgi:hypothetical protein
MSTGCCAPIFDVETPVECAYSPLGSNYRCNASGPTKRTPIMRLFLPFSAATVAVATFCGTPAVAQPRPEILTEIPACIPGRVWVWGGTEPIPATLVGPGKTPATCMVVADEFLHQGEVEQAKDQISAVQAPSAPDARMIELGKLATIDPSQERAMYAMATDTHANARVYFSRYFLTVNDSTIVARLCNTAPDSNVCKLANEQFHNGVTANNRVIDARNAAAEVAEREARASSEPVNSGYYGSGGGSVSAPYTPGSGTTTTAPPVAGVQSESEIRRGQAACRAGSGPC